MSPEPHEARAAYLTLHEKPFFVVHQIGNCAPAPSARPATHNFLVLAFYTSGAMRMEQLGRWSLTAGDVLLIPAGAPHRALEASDAERWLLGVCPACFAAEGSSELLDPFDRVRSGSSAAVSIPEARRAFLASLFRELEGEIARADSGTATAQRALVTLILTEVARAAASSPAVAPSSNLVADALRFIERRCFESISLQDVADAVHRSPAHVTTLVRRATGRSVQAWIIAGRLAEARRRLLHSDEIVEVIAERVGYADATHFIRLFRREHGVTPAAWRAKQLRAG